MDLFFFFCGFSFNYVFVHSESRRWETVVGERGVGPAGYGEQEGRAEPAGAAQQDQRGGAHEGVRPRGSER